MNRGKSIIVKGTEISLLSRDDDYFISITDMIKAKDGDFFISDWLRNRNTVEFLGIWESINNPDFNYGEFAIIRSQAGLNNYKISVKEWVEKTNAIGIKSTAGRYGGTYAHSDIAFEFGMWISPEFKIYLIKEFDKVLGLNLLRDGNNKIDADLEQYIISKINERNDAKMNKDYAKADEIRNELKERGIIIKDTREGTTYEIV